MRRWWASWQTDPRAEDLGIAMLHHAAELVEMGTDEPEHREVLLDAVLDTLVAQQNGSTRVPLSDAMRSLAEEHAVPQLLTTNADGYRPLIVTDGWLYHQRTLHYERELSARVRDRLALTLEPVPGLEAAMAEVLAAPTFPLSDEQQRAVELAAIAPLSVVTGGPGTGKTSIVVSLLRVLARCGVDPDRIALAAPTGKAANRLGESIETQLQSLGELSAADEQLTDEQRAPVTLHRLLKYSGTHARFMRDEDDPIDADWVIVDEASMIDLVLMERLARCVSPTARLVLLGDVEQLPSVETGTVLRDLIGPVAEHDADQDHVARLRASFRMDPSDPAGHGILTMAGYVRDGESEALGDLSEVPTGITFEHVAPHLLRSRLLDFVDHWFDQRVTALDKFNMLCRQSYDVADGEFDEAAQADIARLFAHYDSFRILCLTKVYASGASALNQAFHLRMARRSGAEGIPDYLGGEPVMMLRNDYERRLFNGDQGLLLWVDSGEEGPRLAAVFPHEGGFRAHHLSGLSGQLAHSWAMTVHKSQGSEFDHVALVLPAEDVPLLSRELLYTAITRARRSVSILGPREMFIAGASRAVDRWSGLAERIFG